MPLPVRILCSALNSNLYRLRRRKAIDGQAPGIERDAVQSCLSVVGFPSSEDVEAFYGWANGLKEGVTASLNDLSLFWGFHQADLIDEISSDPDFWKQHQFIPLFTDAAGSYVVQMADGSIHLYDPGAYDDAPMLWPALGDLLTTLNEAYAFDLILLDEKKDKERWLELCLENHPKISFWQEEMRRFRGA